MINYAYMCYSKWSTCCRSFEGSSSASFLIERAVVFWENVNSSEVNAGLPLSTSFYHNLNHEKDRYCKCIVTALSHQTWCNKEKQMSFHPERETNILWENTVYRTLKNICCNWQVGISDILLQFKGNIIDLLPFHLWLFSLYLQWELKNNYLKICLV